MNVRPSILCPVDYSEASAGALRYAAAIAEHFATRLIVLVVEDPLLTVALDLGAGVHWTPALSEQELATFVSDAVDATTVALCEYDVATGKPAAEILRVARERSCDLIVMSSHGLTGARRLFFGSTTERVLRETTVPVLVTPPSNPGRVRVEDARDIIRRVVVPVDLTSASAYQLQVAGGLADALNIPLVLVHVIEPVRSRLLGRADLVGLESRRRADADEAMARLVASRPNTRQAEALVVFGDPAEEACKVVRDRRAGLVVMGLHGSPMLGPRMGSVTYRMLCLLPTLVLALPPKVAATTRPAMPLEE